MTKGLVIVVSVCFLAFLRCYVSYNQPTSKFDIAKLTEFNSKLTKLKFKIVETGSVNVYKYNPLYQPEKNSSFGVYSKKLGNRRCENLDEISHCTDPRIMDELVHVMHVSWRIPRFLPYHYMLYINTSIVPMDQTNGRSLAPQFIYLLESMLKESKANHFVVYEDDVVIRDHNKLLDQACVAALSPHPFVSFSPSSSTCEFLFGIYAFYLHRSFAETLLENLKTFYRNPDEKLLVDFYLASAYNLTSYKSNLANHVGKSLRSRRDPQKHFIF